MRLRKLEKTSALIAGDLIAMVLAYVLSVYLGYRKALSWELLWRFEWSFLMMIMSAFLVFIVLDVYVFHKMPKGLMNNMILTGLGLGISAAVTIVAFFFLLEPVARAVYLLFYPLAWLLIGAFRYANERISRSQILWNVMLVGEAGQCAEVERLITGRSYLRSRVVGYLSTDSSFEDSSSCPCIGTSESLMVVARDKGVNQIIVAASSVSPELMNGLLSAMKARIIVSDHRQIIETITGKVSIDHVNDTWFIDELANVERRYYWIFKRSVDIVLAILGLCVAAPLIALSALLVKLDSRGPILYSQKRIGRRGVPFRLWKLRTMVNDADRNGVHWTLDNDARITRVGRSLRKLHFDELPQLWNILKGEMTLIGPRPEAESLVEMYSKEIPYYQERHMVTPGVTGWAQINFNYGNSVEDAREKLRYDFYYIKNRNLLLDLFILLRTIRTVVTGRGAL